MGGPGSGRRPGSSNKKSNLQTKQKSMYRRQPSKVKTILRGGINSRNEAANRAKAKAFFNK